MHRRLGGILLSRVGLALDTDLARGDERPLGQGRTHQLVHQHGEQHHIAHDLPVAELLGGQRHAQRHPRLGQQGDSQVFGDLLTAPGHGAAPERAQVLAQGPEDDIYHADEQYQRIRQDAQVQLRAGQQALSLRPMQIWT